MVQSSPSLLCCHVVTCGMAVAVKTLFTNDRMSASDKAKLCADFEKEAGLLCQLRHPNCVNVLAVSLRELTLVMEYYPNSLADVISEHKGGLSTAMLTTVASGIAAGMLYLHSMPTPIIHRDLKPGNILMEADGNPRIADFGISRMDSGDDVTMTKIGTPLYSAPEVLNDRVYTVKVDVYSFGVMLLEMATGEKPFSGAGMPKGHKLLSAVADGGLRPVIPAHVSPTIAALVQQCWQAEPEHRPSFADIVDGFRGRRSSRLTKAPS